MASDLTSLDTPGWDALRNALNQRVVLVNETLIPSKRNRVWVIETDVRPVVLKRSLSMRGEHEFEMLSKARGNGLNVPLPLYRSGEYMVIEYIAGERCDSLINHMFSNEAAEELARWLAGFHQCFSKDGRCMIMVDAELSNFVMSDGRLFGLDFEDVVAGEPLEDLGCLISSILGSEPLFTPIKFDLCKRLLETYEAETGTEALESVRPFVAKHLRLSTTSRPLFRKTFMDAARRLERDGWPRLA
jgi:aminoglycoside phosphotransferase (APT) family kinase protein